MNDTWSRIAGEDTLTARAPNSGSIEFVISGGGLPIPAGFQGSLKIPFACVIESWELIANHSGSIVVDIWKNTYGNLPLTIADSITGAAKPTISSTTRAASSTLTDWTTSIAANDYLGFNVDSVATLTAVTLILNYTKV